MEPGTPWALPALPLLTTYRWCTLLGATIDVKMKFLTQLPERIKLEDGVTNFSLKLLLPRQVWTVLLDIAFATYLLIFDREGIGHDVA